MPWTACSAQDQSNLTADTAHASDRLGRQGTLNHSRVDGTLTQFFYLSFFVHKHYHLKNCSKWYAMKFQFFKISCTHKLNKRHTGILKLIQIEKSPKLSACRKKHRQLTYKLTLYQPFHSTRNTQTYSV